MGKDTVKVGLELELAKGKTLGDFKSITNGLKDAIKLAQGFKKQLELISKTSGPEFSQLFKDLGQFKQTLSSGGVQASITNAGTSGILAQRKALPGNTKTQLDSNELTSAAKALKVHKQITAEQKILNANGKKGNELQRAKIALQKEEILAGRRFVRTQSLGSEKQIASLKKREETFARVSQEFKDRAAQEKKASQEKERSARREATQAKNAEQAEKRRQDALTNNVSTQKRAVTNSKAQLKQQEDLNRKIGEGTREQRARSALVKKELQLTKALNANKGKESSLSRRLTKEVQNRERILKKILTSEKEIVSLKERGNQARSLKQESLFGDGGAFLFKTQFRLLAHFKLIQSVTGAYGFLSGFVVDLDKNMKSLQAITATTNTEMLGLRKTVISVSETTKFTAVEVADAARILGQAGFSTNDIRETLQSVTLLAAATGTGLKESADVMTSVMAVFNMEATQSTKVVNVLTAAINNSKLDMNKLALGVQFASNIAKQAGLSFTELTAVLGGLANAGIRSGSTMGTGVRQVLIGLQKPSEAFKQKLKQLGLTMEDVNIRSKGFSGVMKNLRDAGFTAGDAMESFQIRSAAAATAIVNQLDSIEGLEEKFLLTEAAVRANKIQMGAYTSQLDKFKSIAGAVAAEVGGGLLIVMTELLKIANELFSSGEDGGGAFISVLKVLGGAAIAAGIGAVAQMIWTLTKGMTAYAFATGEAAVATGVLARAGTFLLANPLFAAVAGIAAGAILLTDVFTGATSEADQLQAQIDKLNGSIDDAAKHNLAYEESITRVVDRFAKLNKEEQALHNETIRLSDQYLGFAEALAKTAGGAQDVLDVLRQLRNEQEGTTVGNLSTLRDTLQNKRDDIKGKIEGSFPLASGFGRSLSKGSANSPLLEKALGIISSNKEDKSALNTFDIADIATKIQEAIEKKTLTGKQARAGGFLGRELVKLSGTLRDLMIANKDLAAVNRKLAAAEAQKTPGVLKARANRDDLFAQARSIQRQIRSKKGTDPEKRDFARDSSLGLITNVEAAQAEIKKLTPAQQEALKLTSQKLAEMVSDLKTLVNKADKAAVDDYNRIFTSLTKKHQRDIATGLKEASSSNNFEDVQKAIDEIQNTILPQLLAEAKDKINKTMTNLSQGEKDAEYERQADEIKRKVEGQVLQYTKQIALAMARSFKIRFAEIKNKFDAQLRPLQGVVDNFTALSGASSNRANEGSISSTQKQFYDDKAQEAGKAVLEKQLEKNKANLRLAKEQTLTAKIALTTAQASLYIAKMTGAEASKIKELEFKRNELKKSTEKTTTNENGLLKEQEAIVNKLVAGYEKIESFSLGKTLKNSIQQYLRAGDATTSVTKLVGDNIGGIFTSIRDGMQSSVREVLTGTTNIAGMFKGMALSIADSFLDLAAKLAANAILSALLGGFMGLLGGGLKSGINGDSLHAPGLFDGGFSGMASGGVVTGGTPGRDSVNTRLMPGEFVLRKSAVDSVGRGFLESINAQGNRRTSQGASTLSASNDNGASPNAESLQQVNVYVVSEDQKPIPGPSDIIATISDNIRRGGSVKRLIKQVNMGTA